MWGMFCPGGGGGGGVVPPAAVLARCPILAPGPPMPPAAGRLTTTLPAAAQLLPLCISSDASEGPRRQPQLPRLLRHCRRLLRRLTQESPAVPGSKSSEAQHLAPISAAERASSVSESDAREAAQRPDGARTAFFADALAAMPATGFPLPLPAAAPPSPKAPILIPGGNSRMEHGVTERAARVHTCQCLKQGASEVDEVSPAVGAAGGADCAGAAGSGGGSPGGSAGGGATAYCGCSGTPYDGGGGGAPYPGGSGGAPKCGCGAPKCGGNEGGMCRGSGGGASAGSGGACPHASGPVPAAAAPAPAAAPTCCRAWNLALYFSISFSSRFFSLLRITSRDSRVSSCGRLQNNPSKWSWPTPSRDPYRTQRSAANFAVKRETKKIPLPRRAFISMSRFL